MLTIENVVLPSPAQWERIILGARNPLNSWSRYDSFTTDIVDSESTIVVPGEHFIGENDYSLLSTLCKAGTDHSKFMRMIPVYLDITAPLYWWKEFDTYKVGTVVNSCSTMHKIHEKEFTLDDFSHEFLFGDAGARDIDEPIGVLNIVIDTLNHYRNEYIESKEKWYWQQMIQLLPTSYNQRRTVMLNYQVLKNIYHARRNHKLVEWHTICAWIETLPYHKLITMGD